MFYDVYWKLYHDIYGGIMITIYGDIGGWSSWFNNGLWWLITVFLMVNAYHGLHMMTKCVYIYIYGFPNGRMDGI